ncbi:MAG: DUF4832 domain-containing protein [bacterium]
MIRTVRLALSAIILLIVLTGFQNVIAACDSTTVAFVEDTTIFANPERGFVTQRSYGIGSTLPATLRADYNITVIQRIVLLEAFKDTLINETMLNRVQTDLNNVRTGGSKVVLRFSYTEHQTGTDAPLNVILDQIAQLKPILMANADVIAYVEAGFIGAWGEWYYSSNGLNNTSDRRTVLYALLDALPSNRCVVVRTPDYKRVIFGTSNPLTADSAFSGSYRARTGAHNDCFLASSTDYGTYGNGGFTIAQDREYLHQDNQFVPQGGETCNPSYYSGCANALADMEYIHWSLLNKDYHLDVLNGWETNGCMDEVKKRLGYRFRLLDAVIPDSSAPGGTFGFHFRVENQGFANPFNPRNLEIVLRNTVSGERYGLLTHEDPQFWKSSDTTEVAVQGGLPADLPLGSYEILLSLPDPEPSLHDRWEYAIRLANEGVWEDTTGYNTMQDTLIVDAGACTTPYSGEDWFALVQSTSSAHIPQPVLPSRTVITNAYPNPFNPMTEIDFTLDKTAPVRLEVYNMLGERVATLVDRTLSPGEHSATWIARGTATGTYIVRLRAAGEIDSRRIVLMK